MEKGSGTARDKDRGDAGFLVEIPDAGDKRGDRFLVASHDTRHQFIADHEIGRAGIFVDEKELCSCPYGFDDIGGLRSAAARVLR